MESKLIVYTVLAITLGYVFVSTIPSQLAPPLFEAMQLEGEGIRGPSPGEEPSGSEEVLGEPGEEAVGDTPDSVSSAVLATDEAKAAASGILTGDYVTVFGTLIVNLTIAFAVYMVARRRFS
jgi:hypothetical protein